MKKIFCAVLTAALLLSVSACGGTSAPAQTAPATAEPTTEATATAEPVSEPTAGPAEDAAIVTSAPDGQEFRDTIDLSAYDNPNFDIELKKGKATVTISFLELWTDYADPNSDDKSVKAEAEHREAISKAVSSPREIDAGDEVTAVYELPCTTWFPGSDANAIIGTAGGRWYHVDLSGENNDGAPELTELKSLSGMTDVAFQWRTTSYTGDDGVMYSGEDYVVAIDASGNESIVWPAE